MATPSSQITDEDVTELCKALEEYQKELFKAEEEIKYLKNKLDETTDKMKLYEVSLSVSLSLLPSFCLSICLSFNGLIFLWIGIGGYNLTA
jgi:protoheme ferro-lyase